MSVKQIRGRYVARQGTLYAIHEDRTAAISMLTVLVWRGR